MSVVRINTANTMGVRRLMFGAQRSFRSSRPHLTGYHVIRGLGDAGDMNASNSFEAGMSLCDMQDTPCAPDLGVDSLGTLSSGDVGYSLTNYMPGVDYSPQPAAPGAGTSPSGGGVPQSPFSFVPPQPQAPVGSATGTPQSVAGSSGGTFPIWLVIALLAGAAIILPPLIKKL